MFGLWVLKDFGIERFWRIESIFRYIFEIKLFWKNNMIDMLGHGRLWETERSSHWTLSNHITAYYIFTLRLKTSDMWVFSFIWCSTYLMCEWHWVYESSHLYDDQYLLPHSMWDFYLITSCTNNFSPKCEFVHSFEYVSPLAQFFPSTYIYTACT